MGQAKLRGIFEQRKEQAIAAGRVKLPKRSVRRVANELLEGMDFVDALTFITGAGLRARLRK